MTDKFWRKPAIPGAPVQTYLIGIQGAKIVKIGRSTNPALRLETFQVGNHHPLELLWQIEGMYEAQLHREFKKFRVNGEWFNLETFADPVASVKDAVARLSESPALVP